MPVWIIKYTSHNFLLAKDKRQTTSARLGEFPKNHKNKRGNSGVFLWKSRHTRYNAFGSHRGFKSSGATKAVRVTRQVAPIRYLFEVPIAVQPASPSIPRETLMKKTLLATLLLASLPLAVQAEDNDVNTRPDVYG